jgi:hypothetical protein
MGLLRKLFGQEQSDIDSYTDFGNGGQPDSVSEMEFCTPHVVSGRWVVDFILRFMYVKSVLSDTLSVCPRNLQETSKAPVLD